MFLVLLSLSSNHVLMNVKSSPAPIIARARYRSPINIRYSIFHCHSKDKGVIDFLQKKYGIRCKVYGVRFRAYFLQFCVMVFTLHLEP